MSSPVANALVARKRNEPTGATGMRPDPNLGGGGFGIGQDSDSDKCVGSGGGGGVEGAVERTDGADTGDWTLSFNTCCTLGSIHPESSILSLVPHVLTVFNNAGRTPSRSCFETSPTPHLGPPPNDGRGRTIRRLGRRARWLRVDRSPGPLIYRMWCVPPLPQGNWPLLR